MWLRCLFFKPTHNGFAFSCVLMHKTKEGPWESQSIMGSDPSAREINPRAVTPHTKPRVQHLMPFQHPTFWPRAQQDFLTGLGVEDCPFLSPITLRMGFLYFCQSVRSRNLSLVFFLLRKKTKKVRLKRQVQAVPGHLGKRATIVYKPLQLLLFGDCFCYLTFSNRQVTSNVSRKSNKI